MVLGKCGRYPLCVIYLTKLISYWLNLLHLPHHRYPINCYLILKAIDEVGRVTWASKDKDLLYTYGFGNVWISKEVDICNILLSCFKQRVKDCVTQNWQPEKYLNMDLHFQLRKALARFRCSIHKLNVEFGRHHNINREDRICLYCLLTKDIILLKMNITYFTFVQVLPKSMFQEKKIAFK